MVHTWPHGVRYGHLLIIRHAFHTPNTLIPQQGGHAEVKVKFPVLPVFAIFSLCLLSAKITHFIL